ncbi:MAG: transglutaminase domain-containing protein [Eubacteriales bacterium]
MIISFHYHAHWQAAMPATRHAVAFRCIPLATPNTALRSLSVRFDPSVTLTWVTDAFGNAVLSGYIPWPHDSYDLYSAGTVDYREAPEAASPCPYFYRCFTPLTAPGDNIRALHTSLPLAQAPTVREKAVLIAKALGGILRYRPGQTTTATTAEEALAKGGGVCQDYTHIFLSLCRLSGIPCRYMAGIYRDGGETHAWAQIHDGERWLTVDPTHGTWGQDSLLAFSCGRDFCDAAMERGVMTGGGSQTQSVSGTVNRMQVNSLQV